MNEAILAKVKGIAGELFGVPASHISPQSSPETIESWDSVQHLNLILDLEQTFGIKLDPEETGQVRNIEDLVRILEKKRA